MDYVARSDLMSEAEELMKKQRFTSSLERYDMAELVLWSREPALGYPKHPPLVTPGRFRRRPSISSPAPPSAAAIRWRS